MSEHTCDVAVIGGGIVGASLSYELAVRGLDVVVVDAAKPGAASDAGAGILSPETTWVPEESWYHFVSAAGSHYRALVERLAEDGLSETGFLECGLLMVALEEAEKSWFEDCAGLAIRRAPAFIEPVDAAQAVEMFPLVAKVEAAVYNRRGARVDGRLMTGALIEASKRKGARVLEGTVWALDSEGPRVKGLRSSAGRVSCGTVALAAGAWSAQIGEKLGVRIPVSPVRGQILHVALPESESGAPPTGSWPIVSPVIGHYVVAWPEGRLACGGTFEPQDDHEARATVEGTLELLQAIMRVAPGVARASVREVRVGLRPVSSDYFPVLGDVPGWDNVKIVTGHGTEGLLAGPYSSLLVARNIAEGFRSEPLDVFGLSRFAS